MIGFAIKYISLASCIAWSANFFEIKMTPNGTVSTCVGNSLRN